MRFLKDTGILTFDLEEGCLGHVKKVEIRNVQNFVFEDKSKGEKIKLERFQILFGIQLDAIKKELYISSAEEAKGGPLYEMTININEINVFVRDV